MNSRYYDPEIGRFINSDEYVFSGEDVLGHNTFLYCKNNPIMYKDPSGKILITAALIVIGAGVVVGGATGAYIAAGKGGSKEDVIEGMLEGALTGGVASAIGLFLPGAIAALPCMTGVSAASLATVSTIACFGGGAISGAFIDGIVQPSAYLIKNKSLDGFQYDAGIILETSITTGMAASVPTFSNTVNSVPEAIGTAVVGMEASFLISTGVIVYDVCRQNMTLKEKIYHGLQ